MFIPVIFQVASLLAALTHPGHIVIYAPGDSLPSPSRRILKSIGYSHYLYLHSRTKFPKDSQRTLFRFWF
ncbi:hypothetical protein [Photorhabdus heterorhabditis]|uniref:hypothetical protein n=1 Tax=Photorhabdus heterorhabditis TaxID=880156 RepID=UPI0015627C2A|nr:hypothetical protein [Photorhabdus heterorhabditis]NRN29599.1 hypothetical protein [Photorhabdus heterorhabditis subsp. aluminescens]